MRKDVPCSLGYRTVRFSDIGAIGIGAMIVFIAMVLVAGISASVLIQTSSKLENQAMRSGQQTIAETATGIAVETIEGYNQSASLQLLAIEVRARAGSTNINLAGAILEISNSSKKSVLIYNSSVYTPLEDIDGQLFTWNFYPYNNATTFGVVVLEDADGSCQASNPSMNVGDRIALTVNTSKIFGGLGTNVDVFGMVIPEDGSPGMISFKTPGAYTNAIVELS